MVVVQIVVVPSLDLIYVHILAPYTNFNTLNIVSS